MNKKELVEYVAANADMTKKAATDVVDTVLTKIADELSDGNEVVLAGFGKFSVKERAARDGRNPATGAAMRIEASKSVKFKAAKALDDML